MLAALGDPSVAIRVVEQRREILVGLDVDVAAAPAVAAIWTAEGNAELAAKRARARSPGAGFYGNNHAINKHAGEVSASSLEHLHKPFGIALRVPLDVGQDGIEVGDGLE